MTQSALISTFEKKSYINFLYVIISVYVFFIWILSADTVYTSFNGDPESKLSDLIYGTAHKPYVKRAFIPFLTKSVHGIAPSSSWDALEEKILSIPIIQKETARLGWEQEFLSEYIVALLLVLFSLIVFSFVVRRLWSYFYDTPGYISNLIPVIILLVLPTLYWTGPHYIYDFPAMLLFTLGLYYLLKKHWIPFYITFIIGCFNKETTILLAFIYFVVYRKTESKFTFISHISSQVGLFLLISLLLGLIFKDNPGTSFDPHISLNIRLLLQDYSWTFLLILSATSGLIFYDFRKKHLQLIQCSSVVIPFAVLIFTFGVITELRAAYEVLPVILFLMFHTVFFTILKIPFKINT